MSTQIDAVILALTAQWQALAVTAGTLEGVQVVDGPQVNSDPSTEWLFVGYDGAEGSEFAEGATAEQTLLTFSKGKAESPEIKCSAVVVRGDTEMPSARQRAFAIMSAAEDALRNNMTLGGLVMHAYVSTITYIPTQTDRGAKARVWFTVTYQAQF